jgi:PPOX class probable F420-dependent enzyme
MQPLTPLAHELLAGPNFAVAATINSDGSPQQSVVWVRERDGEVIFSTVEGRAKPRNLLRDSTISVLVIDRENGYRASTIHGQARLESDNADELVDELSHNYTGQPWVETQTRPRVMVVVTPARITDYGNPMNLSPVGGTV